MESCSGIKSIVFFIVIQITSLLLCPRWFLHFFINLFNEFNSLTLVSDTTDRWEKWTARIFESDCVCVAIFLYRLSLTLSLSVGQNNTKLLTDKKFFYTLRLVTIKHDNVTRYLKKFNSVFVTTTTYKEKRSTWLSVGIFERVKSSGKSAWLSQK